MKVQNRPDNDTRQRGQVDRRSGETAQDRNSEGGHARMRQHLASRAAALAALRAQRVTWSLTVFLLLKDTYFQRQKDGQ